MTATKSINDKIEKKISSTKLDKIIIIVGLTNNNVNGKYIKNNSGFIINNGFQMNNNAISGLSINNGFHFIKNNLK